MSAGQVERVLDRFVGEVARVLPIEAVWAHGSLALGDFRPGRSDLDLIAVVARPVAPGQRRALTALHKRLDRDPAAEKLHCSYMPRRQLAETARPHLTWAHRGVLERPVGLVTRSELLLGGRTFTGPPPTELVPDVSGEELAAFVREDLRRFWLPSSGPVTRPSWLRDVWVDLGPLTAARAGVTLREGRLITKGEALTELAALGAPRLVLADIRQRRYGAARPAPLPWRVRRGELARRFTHRTVQELLAREAGSRA